MARYQCAVCGYLYDEAQQGTAWDELPHDWACPACGASKTAFGRAGSPAGGVSGGWPVNLRGAHRWFGYLFVGIYLLMLWQMVPRLWTYQIEFPPRTVVHIVLGIAIGAVLLLKILVVRFFPMLDASLVSRLGSSVFIGSVILIGISAPFALQEVFLERSTVAEGLYSEENLQQLHSRLVGLGLDSGEAARYGSPVGLRAGRQVLRRDCIECHDLRTVLARPRTPENWRMTVRRMADRTTMLDPLDEEQQWLVTAYLIAISPQLQQSTQQLRDQETLSRDTRAAVRTAQPGEPSVFDQDAARQVFESKCAQCHPVTLVDMVPPESAEGARDLVARMVDEGLVATAEELSQIVHYLTVTYADQPGD